MSVTCIILVALTYNLAFLHHQSPLGTTWWVIIIDFRNTAPSSCATWVHDTDSHLLFLHRNLGVNLLPIGKPHLRRWNIFRCRHHSDYRFWWYHSAHGGDESAHISIHAHRYRSARGYHHQYCSTLVRSCTAQETPAEETIESRSFWKEKEGCWES